MKIQNVSLNTLIIGGVRLSSNQIISLDTYSPEDLIAYEDEFIRYKTDGSLKFIDDSNNVVLDDNVITAYINTQQVQETNPELIVSDKDFYYDYKTLELNYGDVIEISFKGYLKTLNVFCLYGEIQAQIIEPRMNKITVSESSSYEVEADYKLKNPTMRITANRESSVTIYLDGTYYDITKTKLQYLDEIYSDLKFPDETIEKTNLLEFKANLSKIKTDGTYFDIIGHQIGTSYNNPTLMNFNKFEDGAYVKFGDVCRIRDEFTFNIWFNMHNEISKKQYIFYKKNILELFVENGSLYLELDNKKYKISEIKQNTEHMFTLARTGGTLNTYLDEDNSINFNNNLKFETKSTNTYFGAKVSSNPIVSGTIGECNFWNYHVSKGFVKYLYANNNPKRQIQTNLIPGSYLSLYNYSSNLDLVSDYDFNILQKENAKVPNLISSEVSLILTTGAPAIGKLTVITGKIHIPEDAKYEFSNINAGPFVFTIDNKVILLNELSNYAYIEEGYYNFKILSTVDVDIKGAIKGEVLSDLEILIEDNEDSTSGTDDLTVLFDLDNRTGDNVTFDTLVPDLDFGNVPTLISNLPTKFFGNFTMTFQLMITEDEALIFGQGQEWSPYIGSYVQDNRIYFNFEDTYISYRGLDKNKYYEIDLVKTDEKILLYVNADLKSSAYIDNNDWYVTNEPLYFGSMSKGLVPVWAQGDFSIRKVKFYTKSFTEDEIINNYITNRI